MSHTKISMSSTKSQQDEFVSVSNEASPVMKLTALSYIHPNTTFRDVVNIATRLYSKREFLDFKHEFECMRQEYATGLGSLENICILNKKSEPILKDVFALMNAEQSQRFQKEFFEAMVPHWVSQHELWRNLHDKKHGDYHFKLEGSWLNKMIFKFMAKMLSEEHFVEVVVQTQKLTWVDDDKKTLTIHPTLR